ncbi:MAG: hypothetical protein FWF12_08100 [Betaproteobacteria bacterium]|nr:hypothetical protein [Betaproteobacteria bacterium]
MKRLTIFVTLAALLMPGCALMKNREEDMREKTLATAEKARTGPKSPVTRNITNFSAALRCMDEKMMMYGIRNLVVITEEIDDKTKKVSVGAKDMLISAVSQMTQRSQAIRLIAYGTDSSNLINFMTQREEKGLYQLNPVYGIRGSISQFDENLTKDTEGGGVFWRGGSSGAGAGAAVNANTSMLGLDLTMMRTADMSIVPGVTSNNTVIVLRSGSGTSIEAEIKKFGMNYEMNLSQSEGVAQATRNLIDLAVIELFGKLTKTPYWTCLAAPLDSQTVKNEIDNWYYSLFADQEAFVAYWQNQMRLRNLYNKPANGIPDDELRNAVEIYREALGLEKNAKLDQRMFTVYLNSNHYRIMEKAQKIIEARAHAKRTAQEQKDRQVGKQIEEKARKVFEKATQPRASQPAAQAQPAQSQPPARKPSLAPQPANNRT